MNFYFNSWVQLTWPWDKHYKCIAFLNELERTASRGELAQSFVILGI